MIRGLPRHIKRLRKRAPPHVPANVEPTVGHQVLTDRVHITELGSRTDLRQTPRTKAEGPGTRSSPNRGKAKRIRKIQVRLVI